MSEESQSVSRQCSNVNECHDDALLLPFFYIDSRYYVGSRLNLKNYFHRVPISFCAIYFYSAKSSIGNNCLIAHQLVNYKYSASYNRRNRKTALCI